VNLWRWLFGPADDKDGYEPDDDTGGWEHLPDRDCGCTPCTKRWQAAVHEAGHIVAYDHYGEEWLWAEINEGHGLVKSGPGELEADGVYVYMVIGQAGDVAEEMVLGAAVGSGGDAANVAALAARWGDPDGETRAWDDATDLVAANLDAVEGYADELFEKGVIYP